MSKFKGQNNDILKELCDENFCEVVIVPHNLTKKFQSLDISLKKPAKAFSKLFLTNKGFLENAKIMLTEKDKIVTEVLLRYR